MGQGRILHIPALVQKLLKGSFFFICLLVIGHAVVIFTFFYRSDIPAEVTRLNTIKLIGNNGAEFKEPQVVKDDCKVNNNARLHYYHTVR